jgi:hypothetical protein
MHLNRIPIAVVEDVDQGQINRDRIRLVTQRTQHTMAQVKQFAGAKADGLNETQMQTLIDDLLADWGQTHHHVSVEIARNLIDEIRGEQPKITDHNLLNRFAQRCSEALSEQVPARRPQPTTVGGISID